MLPHRDRSDAWAATPMGDGEGLVQVQMADVGAEASRPSEADHGIQVRAVEIDLPTMVVDQLADLHDGLLEHAVGRGIGDHQRGEVRGMVMDLVGKVVHVDISVLV